MLLQSTNSIGTVRRISAILIQDRLLKITVRYQSVLLLFMHDLFIVSINDLMLRWTRYLIIDKKILTFVVLKREKYKVKQLKRLTIFTILSCNTIKHQIVKLLW